MNEEKRIMNDSADKGNFDGEDYHSSKRPKLSVSEKAEPKEQALLASKDSGRTPPQLKDSIYISTESNVSKQSNEEGKHLETPLSLLSNSASTIQTLTVSDTHCNLLLTHLSVSKEGEKQQPFSKSLLKFTTVPFHKEILGCNPISIPGETNVKESDLEASKRIVLFLQKYDFHLKSESGAEYSYYSAAPSTKFSPEKLLDVATQKNDDDGRSNLKIGSFNVELISPATERQIRRAMPISSSFLVNETPDIYENITKKFIQSITSGTSLSWIHNIIEGKKEQERLLMNTDSFILNIDTKWRSHPDPLIVPRKEWYDHKSVEDLYCLGIFKEHGIATLRDLRAKHVPILKSLCSDGQAMINKIYGVKKEELRVFVHYQPQFYHFHVHFTRLTNEIGAQVERGHLVTDIIQNLEMDPDYYKKRTISYKLRLSDPLYQLIQNQEKR